MKTSERFERFLSYTVRKNAQFFRRAGYNIDDLLNMGRWLFETQGEAAAIDFMVGVYNEEVQQGNGWLTYSEIANGNDDLNFDELYNNEFFSNLDATYSSDKLSATEEETQIISKIGIAYNRTAERVGSKSTFYDYLIGGSFVGINGNERQTARRAKAIFIEELKKVLPEYNAEELYLNIPKGHGAIDLQQKMEHVTAHLERQPQKNAAISRIIRKLSESARPAIEELLKRGNIKQEGVFIYLIKPYTRETPPPAPVLPQSIVEKTERRRARKIAKAAEEAKIKETFKEITVFLDYNI